MATMGPLLLAQGFLLASPAVCNIVFLLLAPWSLWKLYRSPVKVRSGWQSRVKAVNICPQFLCIPFGTLLILSRRLQE